VKTNRRTARTTKDPTLKGRCLARVTGKDAQKSLDEGNAKDDERSDGPASNRQPAGPETPFRSVGGPVRTSDANK